MIYIVSSFLNYHYFQDYCDSLINNKYSYGNHTIKLLHYLDPKQLKLNLNDFYIFCQVIPDIFLKKPIKYKLCLFNTEQLSAKESHRISVSDMIKSVLNLGIPVIDYDLYQSTLLSNEKHIYLPYQCYDKENKYLRRLVNNTPKIYDVGFCCVGKSVRRKAIYDELIKRNIKVVDIMGWKTDRDVKIAQSKILINVHHEEDYQIFEHLRCDRWVLAGQLIVSESSLSDDLLDVKDLIIFEQYNLLVDKVKEIVKNYDEYYLKFIDKLKSTKREIINQRSDKFKNFIDYLV